MLPFQMTKPFSAIPHYLGLQEGSYQIPAIKFILALNEILKFTEEWHY